MVINADRTKTIEKSHIDKLYKQTSSHYLVVNHFTKKDDNELKLLT